MKSLIINLIERYPDIAAIIMPKRVGPINGASAAPVKISMMSKSAEPKITGIDIMKENLTAKALSNPARNAPVTVLPLLDIPGRMANPWKRPGMIESLSFAFSSVMVPLLSLLLIIISIAVIIRAKPTKIRGRVSMASPSKNPTKAAGTDAMMTKMTNF